MMQRIHNVMQRMLDDGCLMMDDETCVELALLESSCDPGFSMGQIIVYHSQPTFVISQETT